jgi:hypothetical protein
VNAPNAIGSTVDANLKKFFKVAFLVEDELSSPQASHKILNMPFV